MIAALSQPEMARSRTLPNPANFLSPRLHRTESCHPSSSPHVYSAAYQLAKPDIPAVARGQSLPRISPPQDSNPTANQEPGNRQLPDGTERKTRSVDEHHDLARPMPEGQVSLKLTTEPQHSQPPSPRETESLNTPDVYCLCPSRPKIPRPRNAFILFRQHQHPGIVAQNPTLTNPDISKLLGEQWRNLSFEAKDKWKGLAEEEKARHTQQYPDYRYKPKRHVKEGIQYWNSTEPHPVDTKPISMCSKCGKKVTRLPTDYRSPAPTPTLHSNPTTTGSPNHLKRVFTEPSAIPPNPHHLPSSRSSSQRMPPRHGHRQSSVSYDPAVSQMRAAAEARTVPNPSSGFKRQRLNSGDVHCLPRGTAFDPTSHRSPRPTAFSDLVPRPSARLGKFNSTMPMRTVLVQPGPPPTPPLLQPVPASFVGHKRHSDSGLPPVMPAAAGSQRSVSSHSQTQQSGLEAMIMSVPTIQKIQALAQIAPVGAPSNSHLLHRDPRGAVVAVEGISLDTVQNMAGDLKAQLERDGNFVVRTFDGPDPRTLSRTSTRSSSDDGSDLQNKEDFLTFVSEWHKVSRDVLEFIKTKPSDGEDAHRVVVANHEPNRPDEGSSSTPPGPTKPSSPTADAIKREGTDMFSLSNVEAQAEPTATNRECLPPMVVASEPSSRSTHKPGLVSDFKSLPRIQTAALQGPAPASKRLPSLLQNERPPRDRVLSPRTSARKHSFDIAATHNPRHGESERRPVPIAIVPRYQLTSTDIASVSSMITDSYDPIMHWRWYASLWRGCVGPDVTVAIRNVNEYRDLEEFQLDPEERDNRTTTINKVGLNGDDSCLNHRTSIPQTQTELPAQTQIRPFAGKIDVEVRLQECRAVVVKVNVESGPMRTKPLPLTVKESAEAKVPGGGGSIYTGGDEEGHSRSGFRGSCGSIGTVDSHTTESGDELSFLESENWEKVKRRVGFEVEEFLRQ